MQKKTKWGPIKFWFDSRFLGGYRFIDKIKYRINWDFQFKYLLISL